MKHFLNKKIINNSTKGFTLVEFIVIMSIFAIMVGVVLFNFAGFRSTVTMENLAHDIALSIRQIQVSSGATRSIDNPDNEIPRGIAFFKGSSGWENRFVIFEDTTRDNSYLSEESGGDLLIDDISIQTKDFISDICFTNDLNDSDCTQINDPQAVILFRRYSTEALFISNTLGADQAGYWIIKIQSGDSDKTREVIVSRIGQVSVR